MRSAWVWRTRNFRHADGAGDVDGVRFVNDCYNANVVSMKAALQMIRETPCNGRKVAVLGDMLELGEWTQSAHGDIGAIAANCGLALLITVGQCGAADRAGGGRGGHGDASGAAVGHDSGGGRDGPRVGAGR